MARGAPSEEPRRDYPTASVAPDARHRAGSRTTNSSGALRGHCPRDRNPQHLHRFDDQRRLATLVVFAREVEVEVTDAALTMFDKMIGGVFRKADRRHKEQLIDRAKMLHSSTRALVGMGKAMLSARANGTDPLAAVEQTIGWQRLEALIEAMGHSLEAARADNLAEVIDSYPRVHRTATTILEAFMFRSWKSTDPLLTALDLLHQLNASEQRKLPRRGADRVSDAGVAQADWNRAGH